MPVTMKTNTDDIAAFHHTLFDLMKREPQIGPLGQYASAGHFVNADECPVPFDAAGERTDAMKGTKHVWVRRLAAAGQEKRQATVIHTLFGDGQPRVPPLVVFRGKGNVTAAERAQHDHRVRVTFQPNAWVNTSIWQSYLQDCFRPSVDTTKKCLFLLDRATPHLNEEACRYLREECNCDVAFIPQGVRVYLCDTRNQRDTR